MRILQTASLMSRTQKTTRLCPARKVRQASVGDCLIALGSAIEAGKAVVWAAELHLFSFKNANSILLALPLDYWFLLGCQAFDSVERLGCLYWIGLWPVPWPVPWPVTSAAKNNRVQARGPESLNQLISHLGIRCVDNLHESQD